MSETGAGQPTKGILKARAEVRRRLGPPYRPALGLLACVLIFAAMVGLLRIGSFPDTGKANFAWLLVPGAALWCIGAILWWPFSRPALKRRLAELESADRLSDLPDWPMNRKAAARAAARAAPPGRT